MVLRLPFLFLLAVGLVPAQIVPRIGVIDIYGLRKVPEAKVLKALGFGIGDKLPGNKGEIEDRIKSIPGVTDASLSVTCCEEGKSILYVGIEERGGPRFQVRELPEKEVPLPEEIATSYHKFLSTVAGAAQRGHVAEDLTQGHSLMADPDSRDIQLRFTVLANKYLKELRAVLHESGDDEQRAIAAYVIGYASDKRAVAEDLQYALKDGDDTVRGNAIRAMAALGVYAKLHPDAEVKISPTWFIEMLNSVYWTDRNNAAVALVNMTESRDPSMLAQLEERASRSLVEMAGWHHLAHALPAYILLGRVAGMPEDEIKATWSNEQRDQTIARIRKKLKI